jgi:hypothetical protein|tara:strand:+ start:58 stop:387 length:330 start_codon:yes stop_codon:yes gene_type:complete
MEKDRKWWDNEARLKAIGKGHNSPFHADNKKLGKVVKELEGASKMHLKQSKVIKGHIEDMKSPLNLVEKDACYKKVADRYKGGNSAYRSGAMVQCRKVGVANWGNSSNK